MGISYSLCLLVERSNFIKGLSELADYEYFGPYTEHNYSLHGYSFIKNTLISEILESLSKFVDPTMAIETNADFSKSALAQFDLKKSTQSVTIWISPWMQKIYSLTVTGKYFLINLSYSPSRDMNFIPSDHPTRFFLEEIVTIFQPVYGWTEGDFNGIPLTYLEETNPSTSHEAPWHVFAGTQIFNQPLSLITEKMTLQGSGLNVIKGLPEKLLWITYPGSVKNPPPYYDVESEDYKTHFSVIEKLFAVLKTIPSSILL